MKRPPPDDHPTAISPAKRLRLLRKSRECVVCTSSYFAEAFSKRTLTTTCSHIVSTCKRCIKKWIRTELAAKGWDRITCTQCPSLLRHTDVEAFAAADVFERYDKFATKAAMEAIPGFRWCISPNCDHGQIIDKIDEQPMYTCASATCKLDICAACDAPWHDGETCDEFTTRSAQLHLTNEQASAAVIEKTAKICPGPGCGRKVEKVSGCDAMRCTICHHRFCWQCLAATSDNHSVVGAAHTTSCPHYLHPSTQARPQEDIHTYAQRHHEQVLLNMPPMPPPFPIAYAPIARVLAMEQRLQNLQSVGRLPLPPPLPPAPPHAHDADPERTQATPIDLSPQVLPRADARPSYLPVEAAPRRLSQADPRASAFAREMRPFAGHNDLHATNALLTLSSTYGRRSSLPEYQRQLAELEAANNRHLSRAQQQQLSLQQPPLPPAPLPNRRRSSALPGEDVTRDLSDWPGALPHGNMHSQAQPGSQPWTPSLYGSPGLNICMFPPPPPPPLPLPPMTLGSLDWELAGSPCQYHGGRYGPAPWTRSFQL